MRSAVDVLINQQHPLLKSRLSMTRLVTTFLDPIALVLSLLVAASLQHHALEAPYVVLALIVFSLSFPGRAYLQTPFRAMLRDVLLTWMLLAFVLLFFGYASGYLSVFPEEVLRTWALLAPATQVGLHALLRAIVPRVVSMPANLRRAVVVGANELGLQLARQFSENPYLGVHLHGFFDDRSRERLGNIGNAQLLGPVRNLAAYARQHQIDLIYLSLPMTTQPRILNLLDDLADTTASVYFVPDIFVTDLIQARMDDVNGMPVVAVCDTPFTGINGIIKRTSDFVLALLILVLISPLLLAVAIGVKRSSPGPIIFRQRRYGLDGKEIIVYKFRSMSVTEDGDKVYTQVTRSDARVTPFGAFIRRTSLDELPQFFNVLQGRMSIVGPRPHAVAVNEQYRKLIHGYMVRHKVKPGITGWAQVNGYRGGDDLAHMTKRIEYDLEYLRNWSLKLDLLIIMRTILVVAKDSNAY